MAITDAGSKKKGLQRFPTRVLEARRPSSTLVLLRLERPEGYAWTAGQFAYVFLDEDKRAYSLASAPGDDALEFCIKRVEGGPASNWMYEMEAGDTLEISRPLGGFTFRSPDGVTAVFLGTGTGVAPLRAMIRDRLARGDARDIWLFLGARNRENLPYHEDFVRLDAAHPRFHYVPTLSRAGSEWDGEHGWIQEAFIKRFHRRGDYEAYVCGLHRMIQDVSDLLVQEGLDAKRIHRERYD